MARPAGHANGRTCGTCTEWNQRQPKDRPSERLVTRYSQPPTHPPPRSRIAPRLRAAFGTFRDRLSPSAVTYTARRSPTTGHSCSSNHSFNLIKSSVNVKNSATMDSSSPCGPVHTMQAATVCLCTSKPQQTSCTTDTVLVSLLLTGHGSLLRHSCDSLYLGV